LMNNRMPKVAPSSITTTEAHISPTHLEPPSPMGFYGDPSNLSILSNFICHVAARLWMDDEVSIIILVKFKCFQISNFYCDLYVFNYFLFQIRERVLRYIRHGEKISTNELIHLSAHLDWLWNHVYASGHSPLLATGFKNFSHAL
jgi:hypothetical protein